MPVEGKSDDACLTSFAELVPGIVLLLGMRRGLRLLAGRDKRTGAILAHHLSKPSLHRGHIARDEPVEVDEITVDNDLAAIVDTVVDRFELAVGAYRVTSPSGHSGETHQRLQRSDRRTAGRGDAARKIWNYRRHR